MINLDCNSSFSAFGIKLSFLNLCDQQTTLKSVGASELPGKLPDGYTFVKGLNVDVLSANQVIADLPSGTGVEIDFPITGGSKDQFAVLHWNGSAWVEISQQVRSDNISQTLGNNTGNELYQVQNTIADFYQVLTTNKTGIFVLVKK